MAALRPSSVSWLGSLDPCGSLTRALREKLRFCGIMAQILFVIALVLFVVSLFAGFLRRNS